MSNNSVKPRLSGLRILVVDDDAASAKLARVVLEGEGCVVREAGSAEDALAVLGTFRPQAIVLDLVLPRMSGLLLAQRLKADPTTRDIVLMAVSAFNGRETERISEAAGCRVYLRKPIDPSSFPRWILASLSENA